MNISQTLLSRCFSIIWENYRERFIYIYIYIWMDVYIYFKRKLANGTVANFVSEK